LCRRGLGRKASGVVVEETRAGHPSYKDWLRLRLIGELARNIARRIAPLGGDSILDR
jgi:hypothetical protein